MKRSAIFLSAALLLAGTALVTTGALLPAQETSPTMLARRIGAIKQTDGVVTGNRTRVKIVKNKVAPPFTEAEFDIMYNEGISSTGHVVAVAEWLHLIPNFHPHFYLHYIGVNDAAYAFFATRPQSREAILAHLEDEKNRRALHRIVRGRSAIIQSYLRLKDWFSGPPAVFGAPTPPAKTLGPELRADVDRTPIVDYIERIYQPNLLRLFDLHRKRGEQAILV